LNLINKKRIYNYISASLGIKYFDFIFKLLFKNYKLFPLGDCQENQKNTLFFSDLKGYKIIFIPNQKDFNKSKIKYITNSHKLSFDRLIFGNQLALQSNLGSSFICKNNEYEMFGNNKKITNRYSSVELNIEENNLIIINDLLLFQVDENFLSQLFKSRKKSIPYSFHVLEMLVQKMSIKKICFTNTGVREGVLYDLIKDKGVDPFLSQIRKIARGTIKKRNAEKLFSWILPFNDILKMDQNLLLSACWLTNIASSLHPEHRRIFALEKILYHQFFHLDRQNRIMLALILYFRYSNNLKENFALSYSEKISKKNLIKVKILGQLLRMAHHITGRLNYNNLDQCKLTINSINKVNFKAKKTYLLFGQSFERGMKNISDAFESLKSN